MIEDGDVTKSDEFIFADDWLARAAEDALRSSERELTAAQAQAMLSDAVDSSLPEAAQTLLGAFKREGRKSMAAERRDLEGFERRLQNTWGEALDRGRLLLSLARDAGSMVNERYRPELAPRQDHTFEALTRLHGRACTIGYEILKLLDAGLPSAGHARWRALHEVAVVAQFLADHDADTAKRYLLHDRATAYAAAVEYQKFADRLGAKPFDDDELAEMLKTRDALRADFGTCYHRENGWALAAFGRKCSPDHDADRGCRVTIKEIELGVDLEHWRPAYRMASHSVHAGPRAIHWNLETGDTSELILVGPSDGGLYEPIVMATKSLLHATTALVLYRPSYVLVASLQAMHLLADQIEAEATKAEDLCERRAAAGSRLWRWQDWLLRCRPR